MTRNLFPKFISILMSGVTPKINLNNLTIQTCQLSCLLQKIIQFLIGRNWKYSTTLIPCILIKNLLCIFIEGICSLSSVFSVQKSKQPSTKLTGLSAAKSEYLSEVKAIKQNISRAFDKYAFSRGNSKRKKCISSLYLR